MHCKWNATLEQCNSCILVILTKNASVRRLHFRTKCMITFQAVLAQDSYFCSPDTRVQKLICPTFDLSC